ncbi:HAD-IA family hydrolase [Smaragdicoccus niigatensis]|uniref:HAD-IA family hydrolase n=1 Tax=Smaragdicoccus niigatensis TaxID=359359 RepID=UPI00037C0A02|nr:HAD-IA family hydrolase [Smaragdicoccus niigatensis]
MTANIDPRHIEAVIFDLDGVVTDTAVVHELAWRQAFAPTVGGAPMTAYEYRRYVDGRARMDGIAAFLAARNVELPVGSPDDEPGKPTHFGIAGLKDQIFRESLTTAGVRSFPTTVELVHHLQTIGLATAVFSASCNAEAVLDAAGLGSLFPVRVDGVVAREQGLASKPAPDMLLETARRLGIGPRRIAVIEDSLAGIEAARAGGFGLAIGIDRTGSATLDADLTVRDAADITMLSIGGNPWTLAFEDYEPGEQQLRESLLGLGNGYLSIRASLPQSTVGGPHYPGTYLAGIYNRLSDDIGDRQTSHESLVRTPDWLPLMIQTGTSWFDIDNSELLSYRQELSLRRAVLTEHFSYCDDLGHIVDVRNRRFVGMHSSHVCALEVTVTPRNFSGDIRIRTAIDHDVRNSLVQRYAGLANKHLELVQSTTRDDGLLAVVTRTTQSHIDIAVAAATTIDCDAAWDTPRDSNGMLSRDATIPVTTGESVRIRKIAAIYTSRDHAISEPLEAAVQAVGDARFDALLERHDIEWKHLWRQIGIDTGGRDDGQRILRLHLLQLLQAVSPNGADLDAGVPARIHGEAYRGHIFWDELFVLPVLNLRNPSLTRGLLLYRYRRLDQARRTAQAAGYAGALYPWQSGSDGREESPTWHLNPQSGHWVPDPSRLAHHSGLAVAYNVWQYFEATGDISFLTQYGAEMLAEIARFWASRAVLDDATGRFHIRGIIGPDEFHSGYPHAPHLGIDDNAYVNVMAVWALLRALEALRIIPRRDRSALLESLGLTSADLSQWDDITHEMYVPFHDGVISQFDGFESLQELDWATYRSTYPNLQRLDRILEAEGKDVNSYQVSKQADVLMLFYLLSADELRALLERLGYPIAGDTITRTIDYYLARTSHGSTLSALVNAWVLARANREDAATYFRQVLLSDVADIQGGTTGEGLHLAAIAGSIDLVQRCFTGIEMRGGTLVVGAQWPQPLGVLGFSIQFRGHLLTLSVHGREVDIASAPGDCPPIPIQCRGRTTMLHCGGSVRLG